ncbi:hypothetical protein [Sinorhizobium fredii]|nr:hypothetical protein [Sinorhizobium fredii]
MRESLEVSEMATERLFSRFFSTASKMKVAFQAKARETSGLKVGLSGETAMTEQESKFEARLAAIEYMIGHTLSRLYLMLGTPEEQLEAIEKQSGEALASALQLNDPATADMLSEEIRENMERIRSYARELVAVKRSKVVRPDN